MARNGVLLPDNKEVGDQVAAYLQQQQQQAGRAEGHSRGSPAVGRIRGPLQTHRQQQHRSSRSVMKRSPSS